MAIEHQHWKPVATFPEANAQLRRVCDVFDASARVQTVVANATATIAPTYPDTLYVSDTTAGAVVLTFPSASTVPGFRITSNKTAGANALTVHGTVVATFAAWVAANESGVFNWRRVA